MIIDDVLTHKAVGYAILAGLTSAHSLVELRRLVVTERNREEDRSVLEYVRRFAFKGLGFHSLWPDAKTYDEKAIRLYRSCGVREEGVLRERVFMDGGCHSATPCAML